VTLAQKGASLRVRTNCPAAMIFSRLVFCRGLAVKASRKALGLSFQPSTCKESVSTDNPMRVSPGIRLATTARFSARPCASAGFHWPALFCILLVQAKSAPAIPADKKPIHCPGECADPGVRVSAGERLQNRPKPRCKSFGWPGWKDFRVRDWKTPAILGRTHDHFRAAASNGGLS
jgi:hypothetical protein